MASSRKTYDFVGDIETIKQIDIIPTMLDVICRTTGMGFAAVARVTEDRWIACSVKDDINFGLKPGGELKVRTTICDEIRSSGEPVIIDHVAEDEHFACHHTPKMYGFQSYVSFPIVLKTGEFFGTLCAIDPQPRDLRNPKVIGMFSLFCELIVFHMEKIEQVEKSRMALQESKRQLDRARDENKQYRQLSNHNLQEPLRKIRMFSSRLAKNSTAEDMVKIQEIGAKINAWAAELSTMIRDLADYFDLDDDRPPDK